MKRISERESELPDAIIGKMLKIAVERKDIISLGPGEPDFPLPKPLIQHAKKLVQISNHYSPPIGRTELREAVMKKLRKRNKIHTSLENITITTGSQEALMLGIMCTSDPTEQVLVPDPSFLGYTPCIELCDAVPIPVQLKEQNNFELQSDDINGAITKKTSALILNTPNNPTGSVLSKKALEEIADVVIENDIYVLSDEAYESIIYDNVKHVSLGSLNGMEDYVLSLFTFSKSYAMCGFRVGYCAGPKDLIEAIAKSHTYTTLATPTLSQMLATKALSLPEKYTKSMVKEYVRRRKMLVKRLNSMNLNTPKPKGAFYTFSNIGSFSRNSMKFSTNVLKKAKVAVMPGSEFGRYGEGYIRCSYATKYELIEKAMDRLEKLLKNR